MAKTLGGSTFIWNGVKQDYCFRETLECLYALCDEVCIAYGGDDGTIEEVEAAMFELSHHYGHRAIYSVLISKDEWDAQQGREKLSFFSNLAIGMLKTDWNLYLQCDEILHEDSFPYVRAAIEDPQADGYLIRRLNLWKDPYHMLNVPQERKPCSTEVIRLAKTQFRCVDDAESLGVTGMVGILGDIDNMVIYHMGFVRDGKKHLVKIKHMLTEVFGWDNDKRAENCDTFIPERFFSDADLVPIPKQLPVFVQQWAKDRYPELGGGIDPKK